VFFICVFGRGRGATNDFTFSYLSMLRVIVVLKCNSVNAMGHNIYSENAEVIPCSDI
jgi:hypothetical protein